MKRYVNCDLCEGEDHVVIDAMGRFREPVTNVVCCKCGLVYQNPKMSDTENKKFYRNQFMEEIYKGLSEDFSLLIEKHRHTYIHT